jgi:uncharacterized membrane protein HdeD (DUF308 family)
VIADERETDHGVSLKTQTHARLGAQKPGRERKLSGYIRLLGVLVLLLGLWGIASCIDSSESVDLVFDWCWYLGMCAAGVLIFRNNPKRKRGEYSLPTGILVFLFGLYGVPVCIESSQQIEHFQSTFTFIGGIWCFGFCTAGVLMIRSNLMRRRANKQAEGPSDSGGL